MKYILMMNGTQSDFEWYSKWSKQELQAQMAFMHAFNKELKDAGVLIASEGLSPFNQAKTVRAGKDGTPITDGVFPESKEFLAGFWIIDVKSPDEAYRLAARVSGSPAPKGRGTMPIEVRPIPSGPPPEML